MPYFFFCFRREPRTLVRGTPLYSKGYREKSHYYLLVALNSLFVKSGLLSEELASDFHDAMVLREDADYHGNFTEEGADSVLKAAKEFLAAAKSILKIK